MSSKHRIPGTGDYLVFIRYIRFRICLPFICTCLSMLVVNIWKITPAANHGWLFFVIHISRRTRIKILIKFTDELGDPRRRAAPRRAPCLHAARVSARHGNRFWSSILAVNFRGLPAVPKLAVPLSHASHHSLFIIHIGVHSTILYAHAAHYATW